jgi:hypothetical protein
VKKIFKSESSQIIAFVAVVLLSRVPFLFAGYGLDADSWEVALTAKHISESGSYEVSRFPGFPVHELMCSLFYNGSYVALNLLTTIISTIGYLFFAFTLKVLRFKKVFLASFALAAIPVIYIQSTTNIDYTWALAFILIALYFVVKEKIVLAGLFLGMAIGCRITSGAMLLPFAIMISKNDGIENNIFRWLKIAVTTCVVGGLFFLPVYLKYGFDSFTYYDFSYPSIPKVLFKLSVEVWGVLGITGLIIATCLLLLPSKPSSRKYLFPRAVNEKYVVAWLIAIDLYIIAFLKLPMEAGYLIPIIPFVILVFGKYLYDRAFTFFAVTLMVAPFFGSVAPLDKNDTAVKPRFSLSFRVAGEDVIFNLVQGPLFSYQSRRVHAMEFIDHFNHALDTIHKQSLFVAGKWYTQLALSNADASGKTVKFVDYISQEDLLKYIEKGFEIYYFPQQDYFNQVKYGFDLNSFGATAIAK